MKYRVNGEQLDKYTTLKQASGKGNLDGQRLNLGRRVAQWL